MAKAFARNQDDVVCRFFLNSRCRYDKYCPFAHDRTLKRPDNVCRYYLKGECYFPYRCKYDHIDLNVNTTSKRYYESSNYFAVPSHLRREIKYVCDHTACRSGKSRQSNIIEFSDLKDSMIKNEVANNGPGSSNWVHAPEFIPKTRLSYADTLKSGTVHDSEPENLPCNELCPHFMIGDCPFDSQCSLIHGYLCEICGKACLNPFDEEQRKTHTEQCEKELEMDMELSFAVQRSQKRTCGICMDVIIEKQPPSERRFGILEKCNHIFCLGCIRTWRSAKQCEKNQQLRNNLKNNVNRSCPVCRTTSDFVIPSQFYVDTFEDKLKIIWDYKAALRKKHCKYFKRGDGKCPFGGACFYRHTKLDGTDVKLPIRKQRYRHNQYEEVDLIERLLLWNFLQRRAENISPISE